MTIFRFVPPSAADSELIATTNVFVSQVGSDTTGDGSFDRPYATVARALRDVPDLITTPQVAFRVNIVPPYSGPGFAFDAASRFVVPTDTFEFSAVTVESYFDAANTGVGDPRFNTLIGPVATLAQGTLASAAAYTVAAGAVPAANIGRIVRVFNAGVEVGRGTLAHIVAGATDILYVNRGSSSWAPAAGDELYIAEHTVAFTSSVKIGSLDSQMRFYVLGVDATSSTLGIPALEVSGQAWVSLIRCEHSGNSASIQTGIGSNLQTLTGSFNLPWMPAAEAALLGSGGLYATKGAGASTNVFIEGKADLPGAVVDTEIALEAAQAGASIETTRLWVRGRLRASRQSLVFGRTNTVFCGDQATPRAVPALDLIGADLATNGSDFTIIYDPVGYVAGQFVATFTRARGNDRLIVNGIAGAAAIAAPVVRVASFGEVRVAAGNITGPVGQDVRAGTTDSAFAGIPVVEAATLSRISA